MVTGVFDRARSMDLSDLIAGLPVRPAGARTPDRLPSPSLRVCDITEDSRTVVPGSLFIARVGTKVDGRKFVGDAVAAGAVAVLTDDPTPGLAQLCRVPLLVSEDLPRTLASMAERFYGEPTRRLELIGITGTNGKTTTAHLTHQILNGAGVRCGLIGTVMVDDGVAIGPATLTTPPATELSRTFGVMVEAGCKAAVMESSSHALEQGRVSALKYDIAVFTNLTGDHLDYHGTMESYGAAKARLFGMLEPDGWAIVNAEDQWHPLMLGACRAKTIRCSVVDAGAPCPADAGEPSHRERAYAACATIRGMTISGARIHFDGPWGQFETTTRLVGRHNVMNCLQALCASWAAGVQRASLEKLIRTAAAPPGRLEPVTGPADPFAVLVDYAHTDDAMRKVMSALTPLVRAGAGHGRLILVFGCGGDRDRTKRPRMGAAGSEMADAVIVTSDNPRTERPSDIIDEILAGVAPANRGKVQVEVDRKRAIRKAVEMARPGDLVLIAGKGHETEQIMPDGKGGTVRHHFDDREVARAALAERRHQPVLKLAGSA
jgi:UDP-N-acetylmuramoyl-L-alanyl-D-glutamate--2,6-diaminopimelate ligase